GGSLLDDLALGDLVVSLVGPVVTSHLGLGEHPVEVAAGALEQLGGSGAQLGVPGLADGLGGHRDAAQRLPQLAAAAAAATMASAERAGPAERAGTAAATARA